jgi:hypothetical protein
MQAHFTSALSLTGRGREDNSLTNSHKTTFQRSALADPHHCLSSLYTGFLAASPYSSALANLPPSPLTSCYLLFYQLSPTYGYASPALTLDNLVLPSPSPSVAINCNEG